MIAPVPVHCFSITFSCIDYFLCSRNVLPVVKCLNVHNFCSLLSVALELNLNIIIQNANISNSMGSHRRLWDASKVEEYKASFDQQSVDNLISNLSELETHKSVQQSDIDTIVGSLNSMFIVAAEGIFGSTVVVNMKNIQVRRKIQHGTVTTVKGWDGSGILLRTFTDLIKMKQRKLH